MLLFNKQNNSLIFPIQITDYVTQYMKEKNVPVKQLKEHIDVIGYQIPNPENTIKYYIANLIRKSDTNDVMKKIKKINIDVSKNYF